VSPPDADLLTHPPRFPMGTGRPIALPTDADLPYSDDEPMDTPWHRENMNLLIEVIDRRWRDRTDFYAGGDMFVYFSDEHVFHKDFRGPDVFVVSGGVDRFRERKSWIAWQEGGRLPDLIIELASDSTVQIDRTLKKDLYANRFRTREYFIYDPGPDRLDGWRLNAEGVYHPIVADATGRLSSEVLGGTLGTWDGEYAMKQKRWLRVFELDGTLAPTMFEQEAAARRAAEDEVARLRTELAALRGTPPTAP
jgi:Uma2 family endonuclease